MKKPKIYLVLKILAPIMLIGGIVLIVLGTAIYPEMFNGHSVAPNAALFAPGMIIAFLSIPCFIFAFLPQINKTAIQTMIYIQQENKEDLKEMADTTADITGDAITKTASAIKNGLKETKFCKHCGKKIDMDSKYCNSCGKEQ